MNAPQPTLGAAPSRHGPQGGVGPVPLILGIAGIVFSLLISGYGGIAIGLLAVVVGFKERRAGFWLGIIAVVLGVSAQLMKLAVMRSEG